MLDSGAGAYSFIYDASDPKYPASQFLDL